MAGTDDFLPLQYQFEQNTDIVDTILGTGTAVIGDFATSVWNSLPGTERVETADLLSRISENSLNMYAENEDFVHFSSFVGGVLAPAGIALKGMKMARDGSKAVNWFTTAGKQSQLTKVEEIIKNSGRVSDEYNQAMRRLHLQNFGNQAVLDNAAAEVAILATMNAHPYMEDYVKDPISSFSTSMLMGAGIVGPLSAIGLKAEVKRISIGEQSKAVKQVLDGSKDVDVTADLSTQIAQWQNNLDNWDNMRGGVGAFGPVKANGLLTSYLESFITSGKAAQVELFNKMSSEAIQAMPTEYRDNLIQMISADPARFAGINKIGLATAKEETSFLKASFGALFDSTKIPGTDIPLTKIIQSGERAGETAPQAVVYSPTLNAFFTKRDLKDFGKAADLGVPYKKLTEKVESNWYLHYRPDADLVRMTNSSAAVDLDFLWNIKAFDELADAELSKVVVGPDDAARLNGLLARIEKMAATDPAGAAKFQVILTKSAPNWEKIEQQLVAQQIRVAARQSGNANIGVSATYLQDIQNVTTPQNLRKFSLIAPGNAPSELQRMMNDWIRAFSNQKPIREKFLDAFTRGEGFANYKTTVDEQRLIRAGYDLPASKAFREEMMKHADAEGYVYLFRGLKQKMVTSNIVESFTTHAAKGDEFARGKEGSTRLYRVKVSDIYGVMKDTAVGAAGDSKSVEILVLAAGRDAYNTAKELPIAQRAAAIPDAYQDAAFFGVDMAKRPVWDKTNIKNTIINAYEDFNFTKPWTSYKGTPESWKQEMETYIKAQVDDYLQQTAEIELIKSSNTGSNQLTAGYAELKEALLTLKEADIKEMIAMGTPLETISIRTNTPKEAIEAIVAGKGIKELDSTGVPVRSYTKADEVETHLAAEKRSLVLGTSASRIPHAQIRNNMQNQMLDDYDRAQKSYILSHSRSYIARDMQEFLEAPERRTLKNLLLNSIESVVPAALGSKLFQSTDFALRDMGIVGQVATVMGKDAQFLRTKYTNAILKPISASFESIVKDPAGVVEFNIAREVNAEIRGYREYRNRKFWQQSPDDPWVDIIDPMTGAVIGKERNMVEVQFRGMDYSIKSDAVDSALREIATSGRELFELNVAHRSTLGAHPINDIGFWMPSLNPRGKFLSYMIDNVTQETKMLAANTEQELNLLKKTALASLTDRNPANIRFVDKGLDQAQFNLIAGRHDPMFMETADVAMLHSGSSALALPRTNTDIFSELANAYEHYIHEKVSSLMELQYSDVMGKLDILSEYSKRGIEGQSLSDIQKAMTVIHDPARTVRNAILGRGDLEQYAGWKKAQNSMQAGIEWGLQSVAKVLQPVLEAPSGFFGKKLKTDAEWEAVSKELEIRGIPNPFGAADQALAKEVFGMEKITQAPNLTPRLVALSNSFAATALLKVMELGQPLVNMLSMPILTSAAVQRELKQAYMGANLDSGYQYSVVRAMYDGVRYLGNPEYQKYKKLAQDLNLFEPVISEVNELMRMSRSFNPGLMQKAENVLAGKTIELLSTASTKAEQMSREFAFATAVHLAKRAYPGLGDHGVITYARNFMDTAIGNYSASQRPVVFQGTMGVAMGLFQTYMVTLMQQIYRGFELRDWKTLAKMTLAQSSIFGVKSLPGFNQVSELIGEKFSDQNYDLTTGTYRALDDDVADAILYGFPSQLGPSLYTRGDIQPRIPNIFGGVENIAAVNVIMSAMASGKQLAKAVAGAGDEGVVHNFMEALSVQTISRPLARISEFYTGHSITRKGNEVANSDEIYSDQGMLARVFATRGIREAKAREAQYLDSMYGSLDLKERQEATRLLKGHIRSGTLDAETTEKIQEKYMRTGSPEGWRAAYRRALNDTDAPGVSAVRNHLSDRSPAQLMIEDID